MSVDDWKKLVDIAGLILLAFTLFLGVASWKIGNVISRRDDAAKLKTEATLLEARDRLAKQEERAAIAEKATEEIRRDNLRRDELLIASQGEVAVLQKYAADSKAAQQHVEIALNEQKERAAVAERELIEIQRRVNDRHIPPERRGTFIATLREATGSVRVFCSADSPESCRFAAEIVVALREAGWTPELVTNALLIDDDPRADRMNIVVRDLALVPERAVALQKALVLIGLDAPGTQDDTLRTDSVVLQIKAR